MKPVENILAKIEGMTLDEFLAEHPAPVLVVTRIIGGRLSRSPRESGGRRTTGRTVRLRPSTLVHIDPELINDPQDDDILITRPLQRQMFVPVQKSPESAPNAPIAVGRFAACDVVINDYTISKKHACITIDPLRGHFRVMDVGSTNGSAVGENPLEPGQAVAVMSGQTLTFGRLIFKIFSAADFYAFLSGGARSRVVDVALG